MFPLRTATACWCALCAVAIANGALREAWLGPGLGTAAAHVVSTLLLCAAVGLAALLYARRQGPAWGARGMWATGLFWAGLTVAFEFLFGHYVAGHPWQRLLADYDVTAGRVWVLVPVSLALGPRLAWRWLCGRG
ncbi:hypothetical protein [Nitratidesulfovibrio sp. SRB-5]|uniref:hypothetical protein n=1 Tax=Nitratidesulfovibrio sp. SRB-5 TaxID=2872636 RepID=UPI001025536E|nr:hypothetical protein [Nitratidesulfovibrio sp. SRB-5]MBZ2171959.1 hypothetical protein [Nitratidesulfovibrio sp. SRB-5]RXF78560.1 hypothetical protein EKK70_00820 [Desulfovibrio sp. DS-1]